MPIASTLEKVKPALRSLSAKDSRQASQTLADTQINLIHDTIAIHFAVENPAG